MAPVLRRWYPLIALVVVVTFLLFSSHLAPNEVQRAKSTISGAFSGYDKDAKDSNDPPPATPLIYVDNFPRALAAHSKADLPSVPAWRKPVKRKNTPHAPLFIGFTRNWRVLQQCVVSYITAGWPAKLIYVVENTGTMMSNKNGNLTLQNPFFLNHTRLELLGVNVIVTPTLFTFAQTQNFFTWTALERGWNHYFWSHMDVVAMPFEAPGDMLTDFETGRPAFRSLYDRALDELVAVIDAAPANEPAQPFSLRFFAYDWLTLVNTTAYVAIGGWDTHIPYYKADCDFHHRLKFQGSMLDAKAGLVFDMGDSIDDVEALYRDPKSPAAKFTLSKEMSQVLDPEYLADLRKLPTVEIANSSDPEPADKKTPKRKVAFSPRSATPDRDPVGSPLFTALFTTMDKLQDIKRHGNRLRWQARASGGTSEPFYRDPRGFQTGLDMLIRAGEQIYAEKWGTRECGTPHAVEEAWHVGHDGTFGKKGVWTSGPTAPGDGWVDDVGNLPWQK